jgi:hypothetical protein
MGFFRKTKTYTGIQHQVLFEPKKRPRALVDSTAQWLHDGSPQPGLGKFNNDAIETSIVQIMKYIERGCLKGNYDEIYVNGRIRTIGKQASPELIDWLKTKMGKNISPVYFYEDLEDRHTARVILKEELGWNPATNVINWQGQPWYLDDVFIYLNTDPKTPTLGYAFKASETPFRGFDSTRPYNPFTIDPTRAQDVFVARLCFRKAHVKDVLYEVIHHGGGTNEAWQSDSNERDENQGRTAPHEEHRPDFRKLIRSYSAGGKEYRLYEECTNVRYCYGDITLSYARYRASSNINNPPLADRYFSIAYSYVEGGKRVIDYIILTEKDGAPGLYGKEVDFGMFIPRIYYRHDKKWLSEFKGTPFYSQTMKMCNKLGYPLHKMQRTLKKGIKDDDEEKVASAYLMWGCPLDGKSKAELSYLWYFWNKFAELANGAPIDTTQSSLELPGTSLDLSTKMDKTTFEVSKILFENKASSIGGDGTIKTERILGSWKISRQEGSQVLSFTVYDISYKTHVMGGHMAWLDTDSTDAKLFAPILFAYFHEHIPFKEKEALLYASMFLEFTTIVRKRQTFFGSLFGKIITFVASVIVNWLSNGTLSGFAQALWTAIQGLIVSVVISIAVRVVANILPFQIVAALAAALALFGLYAGIMQLANISKAFTILHMNAKNLLEASSGLIGSSVQKQQAHIQEQLKDYNRKMQELQEERSYTRPPLINDRPPDSSRFISPGETLDEMVSRTITYNVGQVAIDYIGMSYEYSLGLPTFQETLSKIRRRQYGFSMATA